VFLEPAKKLKGLRTVTVVDPAHALNVAVALSPTIVGKVKRMFATTVSVCETSLCTRLHVKKGAAERRDAIHDPTTYGDTRFILRSKKYSSHSDISKEIVLTTIRRFLSHAACCYGDDGDCAWPLSVVQFWPGGPLSTKHDLQHGHASSQQSAEMMAFIKCKTDKYSVPYRRRINEAERS
jgi:hypothetical protein